MFSINRLAVIAYALTIFLGGYLAVSTLKGMWTAADSFNQLAAASSYGEENLNRTLLVFDDISGVEPAAGSN